MGAIYGAKIPDLCMDDVDVIRITYIQHTLLTGNFSSATTYANHAPNIAVEIEQEYFTAIDEIGNDIPLNVIEYSHGEGEVLECYDEQSPLL